MKNNQHNKLVMFNFLNVLCLLGDLQIKCEGRLAIITNNLDFFYHTIPPIRQKPLNVNEISLATIHLNSLYVNLSGAIDNIAWTLTYEFNLLGCANIDIEKNLSLRTKINLFNKKFLPEIEKINVFFEAYKKFLDEKANWYSDFLKFRHPSTHRIPLYVPPAFLNKSESEKYIYHQTKHLEEACKSKYEEADKHLNQINSLGTFIPIFAHDPDEEPSLLYPIIITDSENLAEITNQFLDSLMTKDTL